MTLTPGARLSSYEILESIGAGGMGEVYKALDTKLGREVAIKVLPEAFAENKERLARFEREARLLASLNHPNIATLFDLQESDGTHFLVLEFVPGETLAERIKKGPVPIDDALLLFKQIAEALEAAHQKGVIHRDLKPANIKVTPEGKVKVLDFGLAKALAGEVVVQDLSESPTLTRDATETGVLLGTAPYMSPEQARGKEVDKKTDIWAFGCCLYEALTGKAAFLGETVSDTVAAVLKQEPDWQKLPVTAPRSILNLLPRCLRKDSARRLHDVADARIEIEEALDHPSESSQPILDTGAGHGQRVISFTVMAVVTIVALGVALWSLTRTRAPVSQPVIRTVVPLPPGEELALGIGTAIAISPDGQRMAYVAQRGNSRQLYLRRLDALEGKPIDGTEDARMLFFSPDGQWVGFCQGGKLMKVSVSGGAALIIGEIGTKARGASWCADGSIVLSTGTTFGLSRISEDGTEKEILSTVNREQGEKTHRFPEMLPGEKAVLFTLATGDIESYNDASIAVLSLETGEYRVVLEGGTSGRYSTTGHIVYARGGILLAVPFDLPSLRVTGAPVPIVQGVTSDPRYDGSADFDISEDGSLLYAPGDSQDRKKRVVWVDREGRSQPLMEEQRGFGDPRLSPDGRLLAFSIDAANHCVWVYDLARSTLTRQTFGFDNENPIWTPDGRRLTFDSSRDGPFNIFWQATDSSSQTEKLSSSNNDQSPFSWSPDGRILAFEEHSPVTGADIMMLFLDGDRKPEAFLRTNFNELSPMFSPNGRWIAYESNESGQYEVYLRPFPSAEGKWQVSTGGGRYPMWNPNGKELFYLSDEKMMVVDVEPEGELTLGEPRLLFEKPVTAGYDVAPDGRRFVMIEEGESKPAPTELILVQNWGEELKRLVPPN